MCHQFWDFTILVLGQPRHVKIWLRNDFTQFRFCRHMKNVLISCPFLFLHLFLFFLFPSFYWTWYTWAGACRRWRWLLFHWYLWFYSWATRGPDIFLFAFYRFLVNGRSCLAPWFAIAGLTSTAALFWRLNLSFGLLYIFFLSSGVSLWAGNADLFELL